MSQPFDCPAVFCTCAHNIDVGGIYAAVAQNIPQFCNIFLYAVDSAGKQLRRLCGKTLLGFTPASAHNTFICAQILLRLNGFLFRVVKITPEGIFVSD